jgi:glycerol-3-phosphate O-acyltransferase
VLERYVTLATRAGVCQAVFLEGGLTRDGAMRDPRLGFLDYMLRDYHPAVDKDIVFVPVGINYDRVIEDKSLVRRLNPEAVRRSKWFVIKTSLRFFFKTILMNKKKRWSRFGYASVNFGKPISAKEYCQQKDVDFSQMEQEERFVCVEKLAHDLSRKIKDVIPVLPIVLMAEIFLKNRNVWRSELELKADAVKRIGELKSLGAPINISASAYDGVLSAAINMLEGRSFVTAKDNLYKAREDAIELLSYYANSIVHWK